MLLEGSEFGKCPRRFGSNSGGRWHMSRHDISDDNWSRIEHLLPGRPGQHGGVAKNNRLFINAVLYIAKTGSPWRDLPAEFGPWHRTYSRFNRWCRQGRWLAIFVALSDPDLEWLLVDSTTIRAHQHAAGMNTGGADQDLGRSCGGFSTKIHAGVDGLGNPVNNARQLATYTSFQ